MPAGLSGRLSANPANPVGVQRFGQRNRLKPRAQVTGCPAVELQHSRFGYSTSLESGCQVGRGIPPQSTARAKRSQAQVARVSGSRERWRRRCAGGGGTQTPGGDRTNHRRLASHQHSTASSHHSLRGTLRDAFRYSQAPGLEISIGGCVHQECGTDIVGATGAARVRQVAATIASRRCTFPYCTPHRSPSSTL